MVTKRTKSHDHEAGTDEMPALRNLNKMIAGAGDGELSLIDATGNRIQLPVSAVRILQAGIESLADQHPSYLTDTHATITIEEAAVRLGLPLEYVRELALQRAMLRGELPGATQILRSDFLIIQREEQSLRFLANQGQELRELLEAEEIYDSTNDDSIN